MTERGARRGGAATQLPQRPFKYHLKEQEEVERKKAGSVLVICRPSQIVCMESLRNIRFCLEGKRPQNLGAGARRRRGHRSEG